MAKSPAFQFYAQDFLVGTLDMTAEQVGGYIRLLAYQWEKGSLPNDDKKLAGLAGMKPKGLPIVKEKFGVCEDGLLRNFRLEKEREKQAEWSKKSADAGKRSAEVRAAKSLNNKPSTSTTVQPPFNHPTNQTGNQNPTLQSSSSSSVIISSAIAEVPAGASEQTAGEKSEPEQPPAEPKRKKSSAEKKKEDATPFWQSLVAEWHRFYGSMFRNGKPNFEGFEGRQLREIMAKLRRRTEDDPAFDGLEWTELIAVQALREQLARSFEDKWLKDHFQLENLNKQFDPIYDRQCSTNGAAGASGSGGGSKAGRPYAPVRSRGASIDYIQSLKRGGTTVSPQRTDDAAFEVVGQ